MIAVDAVHDLNMFNDIFHLYWEEDAALHMCTNILHFKDLVFWSVRSQISILYIHFVHYTCKHNVCIMRQRQTVLAQIRRRDLHRLIWTYTFCLYSIRVSIVCLQQAFSEECVGPTKRYFLISQPKHMLWVLKRTVSMRRFF